MNMKVLPVVAVVAAMSTITACGDNDEPDSPSDPAFTSSLELDDPLAEGPPNPVDILRKVPDCEIPEGTSVGQKDVYGNSYARCEMPLLPIDEYMSSAPSVLVRTMADPYDQPTENLFGDDGTIVMIGDMFSLTLTADPQVMSQVDINGIADAVGAEVQPNG